MLICQAHSGGGAARDLQGVGIKRKEAACRKAAVMYVFVMMFAVSLHIVPALLLATGSSRTS